MRLRIALSRKHLLGLCLAFSMIACLSGPRLARPMRHLADFLLPPMSDAPMYLVTQLGSKLSAPDVRRVSLAEAKRIEEENEYLRRLVAYWRYEREMFLQRAQELANFQRLYGPTKDLACELIPAWVVAAGSLAYDGSRVVRHGGSDKVPVGAFVTTRDLLTQRSKALPPWLAVVNRNSLVGQIVDSGAFTARLQLVTDAGFRLPCRIRRVISPTAPRMVTVTEGSLPRRTTLTPENNEPIDVMAVGDGTRGLTVPNVKEYHGVLPGDLLLTAGRTASLPTEIHVGKVTKVQRDPKGVGFVTLHVQPHADLENLRDVYILSPLELPTGGGS